MEVRAGKLRANSPDVRFKYQPQGATLREFHESDAFVRCLIGPLGSGKTQAALFAIFHAIDTQTPDRSGQRRSRWLAVRNTYADLQTTTITDFRAISDELGVGTFFNGQPAMWRCHYRKQDGTEVKGEVIFRAFDGADDEKKARGLQLTGVWFNEFKELNKQNVDLCMSRVKRYPAKAQVPKAKFSIIADSNAPDRDEWLGKIALTLKPEGWWIGIQPGAMVRKGSTWELNPKAENLHNLPDRYYQDLATSDKKEAWIRKNLGNEFVFHTSGRPVHKGFSETLHVGECRPTPGIKIYGGVDFGRTPAGVLLQRQLNGQWYIFKELCTVNTAALEFGKAFQRVLNEDYAAYTVEVTADPAGDDMSQTRDETPIQMLELAGLDAWPAYTNDFEERITVLDQLLGALIDGQPAIMIDPACVTLIRGLAGAYQFKRVAVSGDERFKDKPDKGPESHVCEALHYGLMGAGEGDNLFSQEWQETFNEQDSWKMPAEYTS